MSVEVRKAFSFKAQHVLLIRGLVFSSSIIPSNRFHSDDDVDKINDVVVEAYRGVAHALSCFVQFATCANARRSAL